MERIHKTNLKTIKYPLVDIRKGLQKKYRGTEYRIDRTRTKPSNIYVSITETSHF